MPLPLVWLGAAAIGAALIADEREKQKEIAKKRLHGNAVADHTTGASAELSPSLWHTGDKKVQLEPGSIICCFVFGVIEHTGIWLGDDTLVELHGSGLIRAVSTRRFLVGRSGSRVFQACNHLHQPLVGEQILARAKQAIFTYREYDLLDNNCHRFVWHCLSGEEKALSSFSKLNNEIGMYFKEAIYWDEAIV
ncbi:lecithin retinol acyltransferase family protein [Shewanella sp. KX20019]|uniref:lecithin retinol acyltransferase family protein n=1 Tax=Shewanella sp. KX20019 TaxID=2803864 RepID=UPI001927D476|nr:lecithin retinol acyltransferase family protein [Shewanella sp. KX20019]QQX82005.1 lecithin retinol acyltransferase family protein [Shewanella sp. KX20019]